jgi:hypothetical protein
MEPDTFRDPLSPFDADNAKALAPVKAPPRAPFLRWLREGLRCGFFLAPRVGDAQPTPAQTALLIVVGYALLVAIERLTIPAPAEFLWRNILTSLWHTLLFLWLGWLVLAADAKSRGARPELCGLAAWFVLSQWSDVPAAIVAMAQRIAWAHGWLALPASSIGPVMWGSYLLFAAWALAAQFRLSARYLASRGLLAVFVLADLALFALVSWQFPEQSWVPDTQAEASARQNRPQLRLTQEVFEQQQAISERQFAAILPARAGVIDVYGLVFAPYAGQDVFRRESAMVADVLRERFDAEGRVIVLLNHAETADSLPWATPQNLRRGIGALAARMDRQKDVLVIYMTSHGASDFKLSANNWPLSVDPVTPTMLRAALDEAGIVNRVLIVSACYSGGWIAPLASETTLVMTAADAEHTSYGCGYRSELTFFGRALFDEQLRRTRSFQDAFAQARIDIEKREIDAGKDDGYSNPQISVGKAIVPVLDALARRLDAAK